MRQQEAYISWVLDANGSKVAIKFGVSVNSSKRAKRQSYVSTYEIQNHINYAFPSVKACKKAERECKQELECGVVLKQTPY